MRKSINKNLIHTGIFGVLFLNTMLTSVTRAALPPPIPVSTPAENKLVQLLTNLGAYLGYPLSGQDAAPPSPPVNALLEKSASITQSNQEALELMLGTITLKTIDGGQSAGTGLNSQTNVIFKDYGSSTTTSTSSAAKTPNISPLIDEPPYEPDPIRQNIQNLLATPDFSFCKAIASQCANSGSSSTNPLIEKCCATQNALFRSQVGINVLGTLPDPLSLTNSVDSKTISQLNGNVLLEPLMYSTSSKSTKGTGQATTAATTEGLTASNQMDEAENYIRYAIASVAPTEQTNFDTYQSYYNQAHLLDGLTNPTPADIKKAALAQATLASFLGGWRIHAAQVSVGVANLYHIFSKRMPQTPTGATEATSQALREYHMATKRLVIPDGKTTSWVDQINTASPATVQKEIAILLSEINYQLYLNRQEQERLLLTNSIMLMQLSHLVLPTSPPPLNQ